MDALAIVAIVVLLVYQSVSILRKKTSSVPRNHDVFLSFKGKDTRTGFTDFLYNMLVDAGIHVFRDDGKLPVGKQIEPELLRAIRSCKIAIPILSSCYAESTSCLRELTEIMDCHTKYRKSVFPVFYKVDVGDILDRRGNFGKALYKHESQCNSEEVLKWKGALSSVVRIRGWISQTIANGDEGRLLKMVVAKVSSELRAARIEQLPMFPMLMSNYHIRSAYLYFSEKKRSEVFLSFRGPDTRRGFAACLYVNLVAAGIEVFSNDDPFLIGKDIVHEIHNAINHCKITIPILSENYASSHCCLDELALMVECNRMKGQEILPIFYRVRPSDVRDVSHRFRKYMNQHKRLVDRSSYKRWEKALKEVGSSKGWESEKIANGHEGILVKQVVEQVSRLLSNSPNA